MCLRVLATLLCVAGLYGCIPTYVVSNPLSEEYRKSGDYFSGQFARLKTDDVLLYLNWGYHEKSEDSLILFIKFESLSEAAILLTRVSLVASGQTVASAYSDSVIAERNRNFNGSALYKCGSRIAFEVRDISELLDTDLLLSVIFYYKGIARSADMDIEIERKLVWPT